MVTTADVTVIGAGIVGLATARALMQRLKLRVRVIEAEERVGAHQTGNNSGVIHAGLYYKPGSLKARNCAEGRQAMYDFCEAQGIQHERCGKLVVATDPSELPALDELERRGRANALDQVVRVSADRLKEYEPHVAGVSGLWVPYTGIVDYRNVVRRYAELFEEEGGELLTRCRLLSVRRLSAELVLETGRGALPTRAMVNCAGLQADRVARLAGAEPGLRIVPFRGEYYEVVPEKQHLVRNLIYPVPDARFPFLGVHFTRMARGGVEAGPNAVLALRREGYRWTQVSVKDTLDWLSYAGFWRMAARYYGAGLGEMYRSLSKRAFVDALRKLVPELRSQDVRPGGAGVRAQALEPDGRLVDDFRFVESERAIHVLNAPSPAATASLAIGRSIAERAERHFRLSRAGSS